MNMGNQFLALSMFIMLLSFFIVLNSLSNFEVEDVKSKPVMRSIALAFSGSAKDEDEFASAKMTDTLKAFQQGDSLDKLDALFKAQISGYEARKNRLGTVMHIRLSLKEFEKGLMAIGQSGFDPAKALSGSRGFFLPTLVSLLLSEDQGIPYRMDMLLNIPSSPADAQNENPQEVLLHIQKVGIFSRRLERAGLPKKLMSVGLSEGEKGYLDLYFRRYEPFNPVGNDYPADGGASE